MQLHVRIWKGRLYCTSDRNRTLGLPVQRYYTCGFVLTCMQTEEIEMHASTKIIVVTRFTTELHAGRQRVHFSILQPFLLTTYGNNRRLEDIVSDK